MYSEGQEKAKIGRVQVDIKGKSYRLRFTYPDGNRHEFSIARVSSEGWVTAIKAAQTINRDIDLGDFDETYANVSSTGVETLIPSLAKSLILSLEDSIFMFSSNSRYARYSPKHAHKIAITRQEKTKEYNLKELWEIYKESNRDRVAKTTQKANWTQFDRCLSKLSAKGLSLKNPDVFIKELLSVYSPNTLKGLFSKCLHPSVNQGVKKRMIRTNPYKGIELPKTQKEKIECFDSDEVKAIIKAFYSGCN